MKSLIEHLWFETPHRRNYINITEMVEALVRKSGVAEGTSTSPWNTTGCPR